MCEVDHEAGAAAALADLVAAHPRLAREPCVHPALAGCEDVAWSAIPGCPADLPIVLRGLLDPDAAPQAEGVLGWVVMAGPMRISAAMPAVVPFLLRLVADPSVPRRDELFEVVLVAAALSARTDPDSEWDLAFQGPEEEHPERASCRAAFAADAPLVGRLLGDDGLIANAPSREDERASLAEAAAGR